MANKKKRGFSHVKKKRTAPLEKATSRCSAKRKTWDNEQMLAAMKSAKSGRLSINMAAGTHGVPQSSLKDRLSGRVEHGWKPGPSPYLSTTEESELSKYLLSCSQVGFGKTRREVKCMVESVAKDKGILRFTKISDG